MSPLQPIDISCPIDNGMWTYRSDWKNQITKLASTNSGDASTAYRFNLCSHTGTYIETSQHKLPTNVLLDDFDLNSFFRPCTLICLTEKREREAVTLDEITTAMEGHAIEAGGALLIATGWGKQRCQPNYVSECPYFHHQLTQYLCDLNLGLLGVDVPVIDHPNKPYQAIAGLFQSTPQLLILAPIVVNVDEVASGRFMLSTFPLNITHTCASLCRPVLLKDSD